MTQGTVKYINEKNWNNKVLYSFKLAEQPEVSFMCGTKRPNVKQGDYISFEEEVNGKNQHIVKVDSISVKTAEVVKISPNIFRGNTDDKRQRTIEYQAARNSAIAAVDVLLKNETFKLPTKLSDRYDAVMALISEITRKFFEETATLGAAPETPKEVTKKEVQTAEDGSDEDSTDWDA